MRQIPANGFCYEAMGLHRVPIFGAVPIQADP
jgi:hypothetical protein